MASAPDRIGRGVEGIECHHHESLNNLILADVYFGRAQNVLRRRQNTELKTIRLRRRCFTQQ
jgi:putative transposase